MEGKRRKRQAVRYSLIQQLVFKYMLNVTTANNVPRKYQSLFFFFFKCLSTRSMSVMCIFYPLQNHLLNVKVLSDSSVTREASHHVCRQKPSPNKPALFHNCSFTQWAHYLLSASLITRFLLDTVLQKTVGLQRK